MSEVNNISSQYIEVNIPLPQPELSEILVAELSLIGYESFAELGHQLDAYVETPQFDQQKLEAVLLKYNLGGDNAYRFCVMEEKNWNEEWEKNFAPVVVENQLNIRATFHPARPDMEWEIVIDPKMSFGTGHHETTALVLANQLGIDFANKTVLDIGCGTGILSVFASMKGARSVVAIDNNPWCIENTTENLGLNQIKNCEIRFGTVSETVPAEEVYDIVLANITRNVILTELPLYAERLHEGGTLVLSGFFEYDLEEVFERTAKLGLVYTGHKTKNNWASPVFIKQS